MHKELLHDFFNLNTRWKVELFYVICRSVDIASWRKFTDIKNKIYFKVNQFWASLSFCFAEFFSWSSTDIRFSLLSSAFDYFFQFLLIRSSKTCFHTEIINSQMRSNPGFYHFFRQRCFVNSSCHPLRVQFLRLFLNQRFMHTLSHSEWSGGQ